MAKWFILFFVALGAVVFFLRPEAPVDPEDQAITADAENPVLTVDTGVEQPQISPEDRARNEAKVRELAQIRIDALVNGEFAKAHSQLSPAYRALVDRATYRTLITRLREWDGGEILSVTCDEPDVCVVSWRADYTVVVQTPNMPPVSLAEIRNERWLQLDGDWWHVPAR